MTVSSLGVHRPLRQVPIRREHRTGSTVPSTLARTPYPRPWRGPRSTVEGRPRARSSQGSWSSVSPRRGRGRPACPPPPSPRAPYPPRRPISDRVLEAEAHRRAMARREARLDHPGRRRRHEGRRGPQKQAKRPRVSNAFSSSGPPLPAFAKHNQSGRMARVSLDTVD